MGPLVARWSAGAKFVDTPELWEAAKTLVFRPEC